LAQFGPDGDVAAFGHGLHGIDQDIQESLIEHIGIGIDLGRSMVKYV
jgi:hypothetical protein